MSRRLYVLAGSIAIWLLASRISAQQVNRDDPGNPIRVKVIEIVALDEPDEQRLRKFLPIREGDVVRESDFARTAKIIRAFDRGLTFAVAMDAADGARDARIRISGAGFGPATYYQPPKLKVRVEPVYPASARQEHVQGRVEMNIVIGPDGIVREPQPISGPPPLIESAISAVRQWKYEPALSNGDPTEARITVDLEFYLDDGTPTLQPKQVSKIKTRQPLR